MPTPSLPPNYDASAAARPPPAPSTASGLCRLRLGAIRQFGRFLARPLPRQWRAVTTSPSASDEAVTTSTWSNTRGQQGPRLPPAGIRPSWRRDPTFPARPRSDTACASCSTARVRTASCSLRSNPRRGRAPPSSGHGRDPPRRELALPPAPSAGSPPYESTPRGRLPPAPSFLRTHGSRNPRKKV